MSVVSSTRPSAAAEAARSGRKPKGEGHSRRAEMLAAAERIFVEHGYEGATIRKIADEVGLSSTALYMHFADKGEILHEICRETFERLIAGNRRVMDEAGAADERLERILQAYIDFGFENPNAYRLVYLTRPVEARDGAQSAAQQLGGELFASFQAVIDQIGAEGRLINGDARLTAQLFWSGIHGVVSLVITKPYFDWAARDLLARGMSDALIRGLVRPA
ncbi:MAG: TetR/AcrR family transcriptional regulator [Brevundimonas sp.]|uniref:TetR/AcrR family transcriptional regulator n=1 Tax=Brevundimonas sp. TaxID=1871086 RepID=UPI004034789B